MANIDYIKIRIRLTKIQLAVSECEMDAFIDVLFKFYISSYRTQRKHGRVFDLKFIEYVDMHSDQYLHLLAGKFKKNQIQKFKKSSRALVLTWRPGMLKSVGILNKETACLTTKTKSKKNSQFQKGDRHSEKSKKTIASSLTGKAKSEDHKDRISDGLRGKEKSEEHKLKLKKAAQDRWQRVREEKEALQMAVKNGKHTEEAKAKISKALSGKAKSEKHRKQISISRLGATDSPQAKKNKSDAAKARWARYREEKANGKS